MQALFSFDGPMYCDVDGIYCHTTLTDEVLSRYLFNVDKLVILIRVEHLAVNYKIAGLTPIDVSRIEIVGCKNINSVKGFLLYRKDIKKQVKELVKVSDYIYVRIPSNISNIVAECAYRNGRKYLAEVGGCAFDSYWNHSVIGKLVAVPLLINEKRSVFNSELALYVTKFFLQKRYPCRKMEKSCSDVVLEEIDIEVLYRRLNKLGRHNGRIVIGKLAAIDVKYKGQQYVIKAISKLNKEGYDICYELVGTGKENYLKGIAEKYGVQDKVLFLGAKPHAEVFEWLDSIDIYIQPSLQEGLPRALVEAMSRGCPCLGTNLAGMPELLDEECLFKARDEREIALKIKRLIFDMNTYAEKNYYKAQEYEVNMLNRKRNKIFLDYIKNNRNVE